VLQRIAPGQQRPNLDVGVLALEGLDDSLPSFRLFRIGREEEGQCVVIGATCSRPQRQRRRTKRAGAA
jgi:hypothetical protein